MIRKLVLILIPAVSFAVTATHAGDADGRFAVDGVGSRSCEDFTTSMADKNDLARAFAEAVVKYQADHNLPQTGLPDQLTLLRLLD